MYTRILRLVLVGICAMAAGCGNDIAVPADAGPPGLVSIRFSEYEGYVSGIRAIFLNADDSVVAIETTDADGWARATMVAGGSVVVAVIRPERPVGLAYFLGVKPGDVIRVGDPVIANSNPADVYVDVPELPGPPQYEIRTTCAGAGGLWSRNGIRIRPDCDVGDVFVNAGERGGPIPNEDYGSFVVRDVDFTSTMIDLSTEELTPALAVMHNLRNVPDGLQADFHAYVRMEPIPYLLAASGARYGYYGYGTDVIGPSVSAGAMVPSVEAEQLVMGTTVSHEVEGRGTTRRVVESVAFATEYTLDLDAIGIPLIRESATLSEPGVIRWEEGPGNADWVRASFVTVGRDYVSRVVRAPHTGVSEIRLPVLPGEFAAYNQRPGFPEETAGFVIGSSPGGYDAYRVRYDWDENFRPGNHSDGEEGMVDAVGERFVTSE